MTTIDPIRAWTPAHLRSPALQRYGRYGRYRRRQSVWRRSLSRCGLLLVAAALALLVGWELAVAAWLLWRGLLWLAGALG